MLVEACPVLWGGGLDYHGRAPSKVGVKGPHVFQVGRKTIRVKHERPVDFALPLAGPTSRQLIGPQVLQFPKSASRRYFRGAYVLSSIGHAVYSCIPIIRIVTLPYGPMSPFSTDHIMGDQGIRTCQAP